MRYEECLGNWGNASLGNMKPEQAEIVRLQREVAKLKMESDILKKSLCVLCEGIDVKFEFVAKHRGAWPFETL